MLGKFLKIDRVKCTFKNMSIKRMIRNKCMIQLYCGIFFSCYNALGSCALKITSLVFVFQKEPQSDFVYMFIYTHIIS